MATSRSGDGKLGALLQFLQEARQRGSGDASLEEITQALGMTPAMARQLLTDLAWQHRVVRHPAGPGSFRYAAADAPATAAAPSPAAQAPAPAPAPAPSVSLPAPAPEASAAQPDTAQPADPSAVKDPRRQHRVEEPKRTGSHFDLTDLDRRVVSLPLAQLLEALRRGQQEDLEFIGRFDVRAGKVISVIIDLNTAYPGGLPRARHRVYDLLVRLGYGQAAAPVPPGAAAAPAGAPATATGMLNRLSPRSLRDVSGQYVFALLTPAQIETLVRLERRRAPAQRAVHMLWPDHIVKTQAAAPGALATIKADAARATFGCAGSGIVWAVVDSGIDGLHPHFDAHGNLRDLPPGIGHQDFVKPDTPEPLVDRYGHGTHVAGIIAGAIDSSKLAQPAQQLVYERDEAQREQKRLLPLEQVSGVAPDCKLVSLKVLGDSGQGPVTGVIAALEHIYQVNGYGKDTRIHGVNLSIGYPFEPRWFACGHSPLCEVVDRLVRSGVVVVTAAGNNGYALTDLGSAGLWGQGHSMSITDPGNAERAITVGATHRDAPHTYGVSYFSSKGPTGDGRRKPDLLAPGERIVSCASGSVSGRTPGAPLYKEDSGTSMAAPHVSGAIAAFLSVRREFVGNTDAIKRIFLDSALDLRRETDLQGHGLLDLLRALHSV